MLSNPALATSGTGEQVVLYDSEPPCPNAEEFSDLIRLSAVFVKAQPSKELPFEVPPSVRVKVSNGHPSVAHIDHDGVRRSLEAPTCLDVAKAAALAMRMAFDKGVWNASATDALQTDASLRTRPPDPAPVSVARRGADWRMGGYVGVLGLIEGENPSPSLGALVERNSPATRGWHFTFPTLRLAFEGSANGSVRADVTPILRAFTGQIAACPLENTLSGTLAWSFSACATVAVGLVAADPSGLVEDGRGGPKAATWWSWGGQLRASFSSTATLSPVLSLSMARPVRTVQFVYENPESVAATMRSTVYSINIGANFRAW